MAGIQISGLVSGINWQNIISELIQADSAGVTQVKGQQTGVSNQISALGSLSTDLTNLEGAVLNLQDPTLFSGVTASSATTGSTWTINAENSTPTGSYQINVSHLATAAQLNGATNISAPLNATSDVSSLTVANLATALPVTAGTITVNGQQINVSLSESLQDVFEAISTATGGAVAGSYDPGADKVSLVDTGGPITLGAANDTSNFLQALKLTDNSAGTITSTSALGTLKTANPVVSAGLKSAVTAVDGSGNGSFTINGVTINYNVNTDSLNTVIGRINNAGAGVSAAYNPASNQVELTNTSTGNVGISLSEATGGLLGALGLTSGTTFVAGSNAVYSVNNGPSQVSQSNALTAQSLGVTGLNVTVNSTGTQTIQVATNTAAIQNSIEAFITSFNQLQTDIGTDTQIGATSAGQITTSILSGQLEVSDWASTLQLTAFHAGTGLGGAINSLDSLGIDFNGTTGQLAVSDSAKLQQALSANPKGVAAFFQTANTGFGSVMGSAIVDIVNQNTGEQSALQSQATDLGNQVTTMQNQLDQEQQNLETEFQAMETAEAQIQSQEQALSSQFGNSSTTATSNNPFIGTIGSGGALKNLNSTTSTTTG